MTDSTFEGFPLPTKNFFSMPNEFVNIISDITNLAELKVIIYVIRHTWGFHEYGKPKAISVDEFMNGRRFADGKTRMDKGTGLSHHSVIDGLKRAVDHGYLLCDVDDTDLARVKKSYSLKMISASADVTPGEELAPPEEFAPGAESSKRGAESSIGSAESSDRSEKYTKERHSKKYRDTKGISQSSENEASATPSTPTENEIPYQPDFTSNEEQASLTEESPIAESLGTDGYEKKEDEDGTMAMVSGAAHRSGAAVTSSKHTSANQLLTSENQLHSAQESRAGHCDPVSPSATNNPTPGKGGGTGKPAEQPQQPTLLIVEPGPLVLPAESAKWCAKTAVSLSEVLRGKRYTADQEKNQLRAAQKMFTLFPDLTRAQFEPAFVDWAKWWKDNGKGIFTLADLLAKKYGSNEIRLRSTLDRMEATQAKPVTPATEQPPSDEDAEHEARNKRNKERSRQGAIAALQARIERNGKFQLYELEMMVERFGMTLPPHLLSQYQATRPVAIN